MNPTAYAQDDDSLLWSSTGISVLALSTPAFLGLCIVFFAFVYPNMSVYALLPLMVIAPVCLITAIILLIRRRHRLSLRLLRRAWSVTGLAVLAGVTAVALIKFSPIASLVPDAKLRDSFYANEGDFEKLVLMSKQDRPLIRIRDDLTLMQTDFGVKRNVGLTVDRWQEYRVLFKKLGLKEGLERTDTVPSALLLYSHCEGSAIDADCKGYAYSEEPLSPLMTSLDEPRPGSVFKQLCPNWYLVRWVD
jgi:hypothetical protein